MIVVRGISHKSGTVALREALAALPLGRALAALREICPEGVVLSTCNRFELYAAAEGGGAGELSSRLGRVVDSLAGRDAAASSYALEGRAAVAHLFRVACGLDSLVVGEAEILGQVKSAYEAARQAGMTDKRTNVLFQRALFVGKKVRSETGIAVGHTSVASVAVDLAERIFGSLREKEVLILGAGKMAELTSRHLASAKIGRLVVSNRTWEGARELAGRFGGEPLRWESFPAALENVDIVICSTGSERPVVTRELVAAATAARRGRSLFFIDIAMPRDVEESVHRLEHVYLYTLADLEGIARENVARRQGEFEAATRMAGAKAEEFSAWEASIGTAAEGSLKHAGPVALRAE